MFAPLPLGTCSQQRHAQWLFFSHAVNCMRTEHQMIFIDVHRGVTYNENSIKEHGKQQALYVDVYIYIYICVYINLSVMLPQHS